MEVMQVLHMNKGNGETSYAQNCEVQGEIISIARPVIEEAILRMLRNNVPQSIGIADLGCSSGPNALSVISGILDIIHATCQSLQTPMPEFRVLLNDLPCNDFNSIFGLFPAFYSKLKEEKGQAFGPCFVSATPGSFYGRLFPANSLHCAHSSSSLHWLSEVPPSLGSSNSPNKGKLYISKTSPQCVLDSYLLQFQKDFSSFLRSRSEEIVPGGCMVLSFMSRSSPDPTSDDGCYNWELLANALMSMVSEGLVEEEKVDCFDAPYYTPCAEELYMEVMKEGSFVIDRIESFEVEWDGGGSVEFSKQSKGKRVADTIRAVVESMLESHFGRHIMDDLFSRFADLVDDYLSKTGAKYTNFAMSLVRKNH